jgi:glycosyltransferase involved in cell wall biosynthesis
VEGVKIAFITGSLVHGGAERHTITLANRLAERGHECSLAFVKNDPSQISRLRGVQRVECMRARSYLDSVAIGRLKYFLRTQSPDVVVAANQYALMYASLARHQAPLAVTYHTTLLQSAKEWLQMLAYRPMFWSADRVIFVCEAQRTHWLRRRLCGERNEVIHNGVDSEYWNTDPQERFVVRNTLGYADDEMVIGMSAVLRPEKNPLQLVDALARLRGRGVPARVLYVGDGPMRPAIEQRAQALGLAAQVRIAGFQQDVRPLVGACDVVALCSTAIETFSLAALEAMSLGRPVVHSSVGGAAEMVRPGRNGYLFPVGDTEALAGRLAALAERGTRERMGARARETVESRFTERAMVDRYERTLTQLATTRSGHENLRKPAGAH